MYQTMSSYCLKSKRNTENFNPKVSKTANGKTMILSKRACVVLKNQDLLRSKKQTGY